jgi:thiamine-phosphate pyrophosphorylase
MKLHAITDASQLPGSTDAAREALIALARAWAASGVDYIQLREKALTSRALETLSARIVEAVRTGNAENTGVPAQLLINGRADIALAVGADGVHLPSSGAMSPGEVARLFAAAGYKPPVISVSCHSVREIEAARDAGAAMALFAPVFGKVLSHSESIRSLPGAGLKELTKACQAAGSMPVFALGGISEENASSCIEAGAAGVAGIRLFQSNSWQTLASPARGEAF